MSKYRHIWNIRWITAQARIAAASLRAQALVEDIVNHVKFKFGDKDASRIFMEGQPRKEVACLGNNMHQPNTLVKGPSKVRPGQWRLGMKAEEGGSESISTH